jgi:hypothetical protein
MASSNSGSRSGSNRTEVPQAREALNRFKMEVAGEIGVPLKQGYNGDLTSAQNGSVGGEMVRQMIRRQEESMSGTSSYSSGSNSVGSSAASGIAGQPGQQQ